MILSALILLPVVASAQFDGWGGQHLGKAVLDRQEAQRREKAAAEKAKRETEVKDKLEKEAKAAEEAAKQKRLQEEAVKQAQEAEEYLNLLIKYNSNFKQSLESIISYHQDLIKELNKEGGYGCPMVRNINKVVEKISYEPLQKKVKQALDHQYYYVRRHREHSWKSLTESCKRISSKTGQQPTTGAWWGVGGSSL